MEIWLIAAILSAATVLLLGWGGRAAEARAAAQAGASDSAARLAIYKDQLAALDGDVARGSVTAEEAAGLRTEVARRMLAESQAAEAPIHRKPGLLLWLSALAVPLVAVLLYGGLGAPALPGLPQAERLANAEKNNDLAAMVYKIERHLAAKPDDVQGWQLLLPSYRAMNRFGDEAEVYRNLLKLTPPTADLYSGLAEALMFQGQGILPDEAVDAIHKALALDPKDTKSRYYEALALSQDGKADEALAKFEGLLQEAPADAPYRESVQRQIDQIKSGAVSSRPKGPSASQIKAAKNMSAGDQQAMIRGMVDGLAEKLKANPNDLAGWLRLIRARSVLGDMDQAAAALATARSTFASDQASLDQVNALAQELKLK
ncbi:MAG: c-type cytochrome biogenesis protein CcmI [Hyphomicrobiales bacterium]